MCSEDSALDRDTVRAQPAEKVFIQRLGRFCRSGPLKGRAQPAPDIAEQGELRDDQRCALHLGQAAVHLAGFIFPDAQAGNFRRQILRIGFAVARFHAQQHNRAGADGARDLTCYPDFGPADALDHRPHGIHYPARGTWIWQSDKLSQVDSVSMSLAPQLLSTPRLRLRPPRPQDAEAIFSRYASDAEVTRYLSWPRHRDLNDTRAFLAMSAAVWQHDGVGPYLVFREADLMGSTGLQCLPGRRALTGYVLARDAWGQGFATEILRCMLELAQVCGLRELQAICHARHRASQRVLEKCGFQVAQAMDLDFPNLDPMKQAAHMYKVKVKKHAS